MLYLFVLAQPFISVTCVYRPEKKSILTRSPFIVTPALINMVTTSLTAHDFLFCWYACYLCSLGSVSCLVLP